MNLKNENDFENVREKFFNFLLKKPATFKQAAEYLKRFELTDENKNLLLDNAANMSLIDDSAYAKLFVDGHLMWGNAKITYELSTRGISREDINNALDDSEDETSRACELSENWRRLGLDDRKIINRLLSRGFSHNAARSSLE